MLLSAFAGCINITIPPTNTTAPTDEPANVTEVPETEAPVDETESPEPTDPPEPTDDPYANTPYVGGGIVIMPGETLGIDVDCDGIPDVVTLYGEPSDPNEDYFTDYHVIIKLGSNGNKYQFDAETFAFDAFAVVVDCDPCDNRLEILVNTQYEDNYGDVYALRVNKEDDGIDWWLQYGNLSNEEYGGDYFQNNMFYIHDYTDIIGTHGVYAEFSVNEDGIYRCSENFTYEEWWTDDEDAPIVIVDMPGFSVNSDGSKGSPLTVKAGTILHPVYSDLETFVVVRLKDGTLVYLELSFPGEYWDIYVSGESQDYYMQLPYAG